MRWSFRRPPKAPPLPPPDLLAGVGPGDYWGVGEGTVGLVEQLVGVRRDDRVLDVGCGLGRIAWPLSARLGRRGRYDGLDVSPAYVAWCRAHLPLDRRRFAFHHVDVRAGVYNREGGVAPEAFTFPWAVGSFTLAIATSLFTHLLPDAADRYLREIARTLQPGGRLFASFFLLDEEARAAVASGFTYPTFGAPIDHGLVHEAALPEKAVAHDREWVLEVCAAAGLAVSGLHPGSWRDPASLETPGLYYQDLVIASRR